MVEKGGAGGVGGWWRKARSGRGGITGMEVGWWRRGGGGGVRDGREWWCRRNEKEE